MKFAKDILVLVHHSTSALLKTELRVSANEVLDTTIQWHSKKETLKKPAKIYTALTLRRYFVMGNTVDIRSAP